MKFQRNDMGRIYLDKLQEFSDVSEMDEQEFHDIFCEEKYKKCNFSELKKAVAAHYGAIARQMPEDTPFLYKLVSGGYHDAFGVNGARRHILLKNPDFAVLEILCLVPSKGMTPPYLRSSYVTLDNFLGGSPGKKSEDNKAKNL